MKVFIREYSLYEGINLLLEFFRALHLDLKKNQKNCNLDLESSAQDDMDKTDICYLRGPTAQHAWGCIKCIWEKVLAPKTIQKFNIYNQGKFNMTDSVFNFICSQNNKPYLPH